MPATNAIDTFRGDETRAWSYSCQVEKLDDSAEVHTSLIEMIVWGWRRHLSSPRRLGPRAALQAAVAAERVGVVRPDGVLTYGRECLSQIVEQLLG